MSHSDEIGAGRHLTPEVVLRALGQPRTGTMFRLDHELHPGMLQLSDNPVIRNHPHFSRRMRISGPAPRRERGFTNDATAITDLLEINTHCGTHIDALGHWANYGKAYGGWDVEAPGWADDGVAHLGLEHCPPLITRGVMLDVAKLKGQDPLPPRTPISGDDLAQCAAAQGITVGPGDVVLVRTGFTRYWHAHDPKYFEAAGLDRSAALWICEQKAVALGCDNWAVDYTPLSSTEYLPAHEVCLVQYGVYMLENLDLEPLAEAAVDDFLFVCTVPALKGGTGFQVAPVAIV